MCRRLIHIFGQLFSIGYLVFLFVAIGLLHALPLEFQTINCQDLLSFLRWPGYLPRNLAVNGLLADLLLVLGLRTLL